MKQILSKPDAILVAENLIRIKRVRNGMLVVEITCPENGNTFHLPKHFDRRDLAGRRADEARISLALELMGRDSISSKRRSEYEERGGDWKNYLF